MLAFFGFGGLVQRKTMFVWPHDFVTIILLVFVIADTLLSVVPIIDDVTPHDPIWYVAVVVGYFAGFIVSARRNYKMLMPISFAMRKIGIYYVVPYKHDNKWYFQDQKNRELLKRWIYGIEHEVETNCNFDETWEIEIISPFFPLLRWKIIPIDTIYDDQRKVVREDKIIKCWEYKTHVLVAPPTMASKIDMLYIEGAHEHDILEVNRMRNELMKEQQTTQRIALTVASDTLTYATVESAPGAQLLRIKEEQDRNKEKEKDKPKKKQEKKEGENDGAKE